MGAVMGAVLATCALATWVSVASATPPPAAYVCLRGDGRVCGAAELSDPVRYRQVVVFPSGFTSSDFDLWQVEFRRLVASSSEVASSLYSGGYRGQLAYLGFWLPGGTIESGQATFGARVYQHPVRGKALTLSQDGVLQTVQQLRATVEPRLSPWGAVVLFNTTEEGITANAAPPTFLRNPYGIAKVTRRDIAGNYVVTHELAHAALNFLDEYTEPGFESTNITMLDYLTPLVLTGQGWSNAGLVLGNFLGIYDYKVSEILAGNGSTNVDTSGHTSRVSTPGYSPIEFEYQGGMFFGKGTFHDRGTNVMGTFRNPQGPDDGFGWDHSHAQRLVVEQVFAHPSRALRPNDRLRNAGPNGAWPGAWGSTADLLLFDGDKNHHVHATQSYKVQVGWYERHWKVCWAAFIPYPCYDSEWKTMEKSVAPTTRSIQLRATAAWGLAGVAQKIVCGLGIRNAGPFDLCTLTVDQMSNAFLPTFEFVLPYQNVQVPAPQWMTTYKWRFSTQNGTVQSGFTGWASFFRAL